MTFDHLARGNELAMMAVIIGLATTGLLVATGVADAVAAFVKQLARAYYDVRQTFRELRAADAAHAERCGPARTPDGQENPRSP